MNLDHLLFQMNEMRSQPVDGTLSIPIVRRFALIAPTRSNPNVPETWKWQRAETNLIKGSVASYRPINNMLKELCDMLCRTEETRRDRRASRHLQVFVINYEVALMYVPLLVCLFIPFDPPVIYYCRGTSGAEAVPRSAEFNARDHNCATLDVRWIIIIRHPVDVYRS